MLRIVLALAIGYLLGSVLPADLFARSRGVDIRAVGTRNPGSTNALHELGLVPGLVTGAYDTSVGLVSMAVAWLLRLSVGWVYLAGLAAVLGHVFPVFFRFRGGQGMAASTGMLVYGIAVALARGWLVIADIVLLAALALVVFALTRSATVVGVVVVPLLLVELLLARPDIRFAAFMGVLAVLIWMTQLMIARDEHLFHLAEPARSMMSRLRPR